MIPGSDAPRIKLLGREIALAFLLFTGLTILFAYPISLHPATLRFPTGPDGDLGWYLLGWDTHAFLHKPWRIFDANIYYPQHLTLAYGENVIGIAFFAAPVIWLTGNLLLAANVACLLSTILCGLGAYVLARQVGLSARAAVVCGIIFMCAPPRFFRIGQMNLSSLQWIPFALAALHSYLDTGRRRDLRLAAACVSLEALSSGHGAVFMAVALALFAIYRGLLGEPLRLATRIRDLGVTGALLLLPTFLVFLPYRAVQREVGLKRGLGTWEVNYTALLASPSYVDKFLTTRLTHTDINATASSFLFPGYLALFLAAAAIVWGGRRFVTECVQNAAIRRSRITSAVEIVLIGSAVVAGLLTAGTLVELKAGAARLVDPRSAELAWIVFACLSLLAAVAARLAPAAAARHRRPLLWLAIAALCWTALAAARPMLHAGNGLTAEYFKNTDWTSPHEFSVVDPKPSSAGLVRRWDRPVPDTFSVRWSGFLTVDRAATYTFATSSDDGSELWIDNQLVVDNGGMHSLATRSGSVRLRRGSHAVTLRYVQFGGDAELTWLWARDGGRLAPVPRWVLSQTPTTIATSIAALAADSILWVLAIATIAAAALYVRAGVAGRHRVIADWAKATRRDPTTFYTVLTLVTFGLALGPPYGLWRYVYWWPGFTFIRVSSRFTLVMLLGLAMMAAIGFDRLTAAWPLRRRTIAGVTIASLLAIEYAAMPMIVEPARIEIPAIDRWLDTLPKPFVIAEVPVLAGIDSTVFERQETAYMIHSTAHWQKTVHGYSGWRTEFHRQLYSDMQPFPDDVSVNALSDLGVTYVVVHSDVYPREEWKQVEARLQRFSGRLRLEHVEGDGRVYSIVRPVDEASR